VVGGEGNGGVILPAAHYGRDGLVAIALIAQAMRNGESLRALADRLPHLVMQKHKAGRSPEPWERAADRLRAAFPGFTVESTDGLRLSHGEDWVHVRPSGTEPVVRVIAESSSEGRTGELVAIASRALAGAS
jgi:phosphomannomutase